MSLALASSTPRKHKDHLSYTPTEANTPSRQKRAASQTNVNESPADRSTKRPFLENQNSTPRKDKHTNRRLSSSKVVIPNSSPSGNQSPQPPPEEVKRVLPLQRAFDSSTVNLRRKTRRPPDFRKALLPDTPWKKPSTLESFSHAAHSNHTPIRQTNRHDAQLIITSDDEELANVGNPQQRGEPEDEDMVFTQPFALALRDSSDTDHTPQPIRRSLLNELLSSSGISQPSSDLEPYDGLEDDNGELPLDRDDDETDDEQGTGLFGVEWPKDGPVGDADDEDEDETNISNLRSSPPPLPYRDSIWTSNGGLSSFTNDYDEDLDEVDVFFSSSRPNEKTTDVAITGSSYATAWPHFLTLEYFEKCKENEANWALPETPKDGRTTTSPYFESNFHILGKIGSGEFAEVWNVVDMRTGEKYAIKKTKQPFFGNADRRRHIEEVSHMWALKESRHCVELVNAWEQDGFLFIQMELCNGGSLEGYLGFEEMDDLSEDRIWRIGYDIATGLRDIHRASLIHLDIKPANILLDDLGSLKIGDFGLSSAWPVQSKGYSEEGDRRYMAPELLRDQFDKPADVFSLGLILLEMAANIILPENGQGWQMLRAGDFSNCLELKNVSQQLQDLIAHMLHPNCEERLTVQQVLDHPKMKDIHMVEQKAEVGVLYQHIQRLETMAAAALGKRTDLDDSVFCTPVDEKETWEDDE